jgi:hypothetical protein
MTRAVLLLWRGEVAASLRMHPLAVPSALASLLFMFATVWATANLGSPIAIWGTRFGRATIATFAAVQLAILGLWVARMLGFWGGPVPV